MSPLFSNRIKTSYLPLPPSGIACLPAEKSLRWWITLREGGLLQSLEQTGPNLSALNSVRSGATTILLSGDGSGAIKSYSIEISSPEVNPSGPLVPIVRVRVCPSPSGDRCSFSSVIPALTSALYCSGSSSLPAILILMDSRSGAWNSPGISSVILIKLIVDEPELVNFNDAPTF